LKEIATNQIRTLSSRSIKTLSRAILLWRKYYSSNKI